MASIQQRLLCGLVVLASAALVFADTREGYENSTTRQQIERMHENARANASEPANMSGTGIQGSALEGQMNRLRAEAQAEQEKKAAVEAAKRRALEEWSAAYDARQKEIAASTRAANALEYAREQQELAERGKAMRAYVTSLPPESPLTVADYDRLLDMAAPLTELMLPMVQMAYRDYPQAFELRYAFLQLSACPGLRSAATAFAFKTYPEEQGARADCKAQQLAAALPYLEKARQSADRRDAALACALMAGAYAGLDQYEANGLDNIDNEILRPRLAAWLDKRLSPCATLFPPGSPLYTGLIAPLVRDAERSDDGRLRVSFHHWWPLVARDTWAEVDINNAAAVRDVYQRIVVLSPPPPAAVNRSEYFIWFEDFPQVKLLQLKPGVDTPESVTATLGKPAATVTRESVGLAPSIRQACRASSYEHQLAKVWRYEGNTSFKRFGSRRKMDQVVHVFFDGNGRVCAAEVTRDWVLPGAYAGAIGIFLDGPGGWNQPYWREVRHQFR